MPLAQAQITAPPGKGALAVALIQSDGAATADILVEALIGSTWFTVARKTISTPNSDPRGLARAIAVLDYPNAGTFRVTATPSAGSAVVKLGAGRFLGRFVSITPDGGSHNGVINWLA
jgi:hypothetical protein